MYHFIVPFIIKKMTSGLELSNEIKLVLKENTSLQYDETVNKVKCSLSGHEMPCSIDQIKLYVNGKKYKKLKDRQEKAFEKYKPHIVPNIKEGQQHQLFCLLTRRNINKSIEHVERHVNGTKYKKALKKWEDRKSTENGQEGVGQETEEEKCLIEEDDEEEEEEEEEADLDDLYPDIAQQEENGDDDEENDMNESDEENSARNEKPPKNEASSSKRKSESTDSGSGSKRKRQKKKKPK